MITTLDPDPNWAKSLDPDKNSMYLDPQHWVRCYRVYFGKSEQNRFRQLVCSNPFGCVPPFLVCSKLLTHLGVFKTFWVCFKPLVGVFQTLLDVFHTFWWGQSFLVWSILFVVNPFWCGQSFLVWSNLFGVVNPFWCGQPFLVWSILFGVANPFWCGQSFLM